MSGVEIRCDPAPSRREGYHRARMSLHTFFRVILRCDQLLDTKPFATVMGENPINVFITIQDKNARHPDDLKLEVPQSATALIRF